MTPLDSALLAAACAGYALGLLTVVAGAYLHAAWREYRAHGPEVRAVKVTPEEARALRRVLDSGGPVLHVVEREERP